MRVAHIIAGLSIGGAERNLVNLLNAMSCDFRAAVFLGPKKAGPSFHQDLDSAIEQHFVRVRRRNLPLGIFRLASLLRKMRVDVAHTHMYGSNLYGVMAARLAGVPVVVTSEHGENPWKRPRHRWLERRVISPLADARFCLSPQILAIRRDADGVPAEKLQLAINGTFVPPATQRESANCVPLIGAVGRFIPAKDYPSLLEAAASLRDQGFQLELCIVGDGPEMPAIHKLVAERNLENIVHLPGMVSDVPKWYGLFDIYVSSSIREGQPVALLEAMAHGLPVVATDVGASAETVSDGEGGIVVPPGDVTLLAQALARLLDDSALRERMGRQARARVEAHYSVQAAADFHERFYRELLTRSRVAKCESA